MKIIVLGASGAMAAVVLRDLLEFAPDIAITAADAKPFYSDDSRIQPVRMDVRDENNTTEIIRGHDAALNCVTYYLNVPIMKACLRAGVPYTDLGGLYHGSKKQFVLHEEFVRAGIPAVLGMGSTPGITNMIAAALARKMDSVGEIHVRVACHDESVSGPLPVPYALDTILDEFSMEPMVFTGGKEKAVPPMSGEEILEFPAPVGKMHALYTLHSEVAMFPRSYPGLQEASFKVAFPEDFTRKIAFLVQLGFASREKILGDVSPREMLLRVTSRQSSPDSEPRDCDALRVTVKGIQNGKETTGVAESMIFPHPKWKIAAGSLDTGVPLSIVGQMLASHQITTPGVLCPEVSVPIDPFFQELARRGIQVRFDFV